MANLFLLHVHATWGKKQNNKTKNNNKNALQLYSLVPPLNKIWVTHYLNEDSSLDQSL